MSRLFLCLVIAALAGCSVSPAPLLTIPEGHPGNPDSGDAPYAPPANPFKQEVPPSTPPGQKEGMQNHSHHDHGEGKTPDPKKLYPLDVCVVSGEKLGEMGKPVVIQHEGREVQFCCPACVDKFKQEPAKYLKKLDEAEKSKKPEKHGHGEDHK